MNEDYDPNEEIDWDEIQKHFDETAWFLMEDDGSTNDIVIHVPAEWVNFTGWYFTHGTGK